MQGASEFTMHGVPIQSYYIIASRYIWYMVIYKCKSSTGPNQVLGHFNATPRLHEIHVPVLLISGRFDTMRPSVVSLMQRELPCAEWQVLPHAGHISMIDDAELMVKLLKDFLSRVESRDICETPMSLSEHAPWLALGLLVLLAISAVKLFKPRSREAYVRLL